MVNVSGEGAVPRRGWSSGAGEEEEEEEEASVISCLAPARADKARCDPNGVMALSVGPSSGMGEGLINPPTLSTPRRAADCDLRKADNMPEAP